MNVAIEVKTISTGHIMYGCIDKSEVKKYRSFYNSFGGKNNKKYSFKVTK